MESSKNFLQVCSWHVRLSLIASARPGKCEYFSIRSMKFFFRCNMVCIEQFKFKILYANRVLMELNKFILFVLLRAHIFLKWLTNLHTYCKKWEIQKNLELCVPRQNISDSLLTREAHRRSAGDAHIVQLLAKSSDTEIAQ